MVVPLGAAGGPIMTTGGVAVGLSSPTDDGHGRSWQDVRMVTADRICAALASAPTQRVSPPAATRLPVEPPRSDRVVEAPREARPFNLGSYQLSSSDFDITFITPAVLESAVARRDFTGGRQDGFGGLRVATEFENWSDYVRNAPPMLYVRATPRLVEGFWMKVARGAASTQGAAIPPIKRLRPGFSQMRVRCGATDVTPVHPFRIRSRVTETEAIDEGFYVFDPRAIGPGCGTVSIILSSVKEPDKTETRSVDAAVLRAIAADFAR
jgi:hypothetical protein